MKEFDLVILGGGPGGYLSAERAAKNGLRVCLVEKAKLGGTCLNEGCIPSKTFLQSAKVADYAKHANVYGVNAEFISVNQKAVVERKTRIVRKLVGGIKVAMRELGVTVIEGEGKVDKIGDGYLINCNGESCFGKYLIIATGSGCVVPKITGVTEGLASGLVVTNKEILDLTVIPEKLAVIGGGVIGLEMASYFNSVGSRVTVIEMLDSIGGAIDGEIANLLKEVYAKKGIEFHLGAKVIEVTDSGVKFVKDGVESEIKADKILLSVGRRPNTKDIGLENLGVATERGAILTNKHMLTNLSNVYAVGDVNGIVMLAHTAYREAEVAVNNILGIFDVMDYNAIPSVIYTNPEVACVGLTEQSALDRGINAKSVNLSMQYSGRFVAENADLTGVAKFVFDADSDRLIGAHFMGNGSSEFIIAAEMLINMKVGIDEIKKQVFPHPTVGEIIREGIFAYK